MSELLRVCLVLKIVLMLCWFSITHTVFSSDLEFFLRSVLSVLCEIMWNLAATTSITYTDNVWQSSTCRIWGSRDGGYEESVFWDITPCSPLKVNRRFGGTYHLHLQGRCLSPAFSLVSCSAYSLTLNMEAVYSFYTSADFQQTTWRYIPETILFKALLIIYL
jgi:hypothetical protein